MSSQGAGVGPGDRPLNNLLRHLGSSDFALLASHLEHEEAASNQILCNPGDRADALYFPCGPTLVSLVVPIEEGRDVEAILIGREGAVGGIVSRGLLPAFSRVVVKFGGALVRMPVREFEAAKQQSPSLRDAFARYAHSLFAQILQSAACNAAHSIEQRAAKWILSAMERLGDDIVPLTHEQLAFMLGVGRSYASRVIQAFKAEGILETRRGAMRVRDRERLNARACLCNASVRNHFEEVLPGLYPGAD